MNVFIEKEIFENIILYNEKMPNWYKIFCDHAKILINLTDDELEAEEKQGTLIFEYILASGGKTPMALKYQFDNIFEDPIHLLDSPRSVYFLKIESELAQKWQDEYGLIVQNLQTLNDDILNGSLKRKLNKGESIKDDTAEGWKNLLKFKFPPSNSIIISDPYILTSTETIKGKIIQSGEQNILWMLQLLLPNNLIVPYHITVISEDKDQTHDWRKKRASELELGIKNLRSYSINVEIVFVKSEDLHERIAIMNYVNIVFDHGFHVFNVDDGMTVHMANKAQINSCYSNLNNNYGDSEYNILEEDLKVFKKVCSHLSRHLNDGIKTNIGAILGDCNADFTLVNRLINDV